MIHALEAMRAYSEARRKMLTRRCQNCGHEQLAPEEKLSELVTCENCEAPIPRERAAPSDVREETNSSEGGTGGRW